MTSQCKAPRKPSKFRLLGLVGQGQFGQVFCAVHRQTGQLVALKNLEPERFPTHKFLRELRFLLSLQHPNIVTCRALEHTQTGRYLVMDYCEGGTLRSLMTDDIELHLSQSISLVIDILAGLEHAHSRGIVHCDIKPENILLSLQPTGWAARISDFGIARLSQEMSDSEFGNTGSPAYMAPERFYGQYSPKSDLYSVGVLLFELLAGTRPFSGLPAALMSAHLSAPLILPDSIPDVWRPILIKSLQKLPARRFQSAAEMLSVIRAAIAPEQLVGQQPPEPRVDVAPAQGSSSGPLLLPRLVLPVQPLVWQQQIGISHAVNTLALGPECSRLPAAEGQAQWLCLASPRQITVGHLNLKPVEAPLAAANAWPDVVLASPIQGLLARTQGCFVLTAQAVYLLPWTKGSKSPAAAQRIAQLHQDYVATIEPEGRWLATALRIPQPQMCYLSFWSLPGTVAGALAQRPYPLSSKTDFLTLQLVALDRHHVAAMSIRRPTQTESNASSAQRHGETWVEVMTRRGDRVMALGLSCLMLQAMVTPMPYRLLAIDGQNPQSILLVDLKPLRVTRLGVGLVPHYLAACSWGYVVADDQGLMLFLDRDGQRIGQIQSPEPVTAIAPYGDQGLLLATWKENQGCLYVTDLTMLGLDFIF